MNFIKYSLSVIFLLILFVLPGCTPVTEMEEGDTGNYEVMPADRVVKRLEANRRRIKVFEGNGELEVKSSQINNSTLFRTILRKPDSVYMNILGPFGIELANILVTRQEYEFFEALNNTLYKGNLDDDVLSQIFKFNIKFSELLDAFIGAVNLTGELYREPDNFVIAGGKYFFTYIDKEGNYTSEYVINIENLAITDYRYRDKDRNILIEGTYSNFQQVENVQIPRKIVIKSPLDNQTVTITYKNVKVNDENSVIDFSVPSDASIIEW